MPNRFQVAAERLGARLQQSVGREIVFVRGAIVVPLTAWANVHDYEVDSGHLVTIVRSHDFAFPAADLVHNGTKLTPQKGDLFRETLNGEEVIYTVTDMAPKPCYEWQDSAGTLIVVHTKKGTP